MALVHVVVVWCWRKWHILTYWHAFGTSKRWSWGSNINRNKEVEWLYVHLHVSGKRSRGRHLVGLRHQSRIGRALHNGEIVTFRLGNVIACGMVRLLSPGDCGQWDSEERRFAIKGNCFGLFWYGSVELGRV